MTKWWRHFVIFIFIALQRERCKQNECAGLLLVKVAAHLRQCRKKGPAHLRQCRNLRQLKKSDRSDPTVPNLKLKIPLSNGHYCNLIGQRYFEYFQLQTYCNIIIFRPGSPKLSGSKISKTQICRTGISIWVFLFLFWLCSVCAVARVPWLILQWGITDYDSTFRGITDYDSREERNRVMEDDVTKNF